MLNDFDEFVEKFDIIDNALKMRTLIRWNGRDLRKTENLSEHTHLVMACLFEIYDTLCKETTLTQELIKVNFYRLFKTALLHDSLELLRGDILSITKDTIPGLRSQIDMEETKFLDIEAGCCSDFERQLIRLADLKACYKFVERELEFPSNDFAKQAYIETKNSYLNCWNNFCNKYKIHNKIIEDGKKINRLCKGYEHDAGIDIILENDVEFMPHSTCNFDLNVKYTPKIGAMAIIAPRSSAAIQGINISTCPIDANYTGTITAIVNNISNQIIKYNKGESFCQIIPIKLASEGYCDEEITIKKEGIRTDEKLGSTGR